jgi:hypothetical protein
VLRFDASGQVQGCDELLQFPVVAELARFEQFAEGGEFGSVGSVAGGLDACFPQLPRGSLAISGRGIDSRAAVSVAKDRLGPSTSVDRHRAGGAGRGDHVGGGWRLGDGDVGRAYSAARVDPVGRP